MQLLIHPFFSVDYAKQFIFWNMADINWNAVYGFWLVGKHGSFASAARALPRGSVQALHKRVRELEAKDNLGLGLLRSRGMKGVRLTEAGKRLYEHLDLVFRDFDRLTADLRGETSGKLEVAVTSFVANAYMGKLIVAFSAQCPDVSLHLSVCESPEVTAFVENGRVDVGICSTLSAPPGTVALVACPMLFQLLVPADRNYPRRFTSWREVVQFPLILPEKTSALRQAFDALVAKEGLTSMIQIKADLTTPELSLEAARAGLGLAIVAIGPQFPRNPAGIMRLKPPPGLPLLNLSILYGENDYIPKYVNTFIQTAISVMSRRRPGDRPRDV